MRPTPGLTTFTTTSPMMSASVETTQSIGECAKTCPTESTHVSHRTNSMHHRAEDGWRNHHPKQLPEKVSEQLERLCLRKNMTDQDSKEHRDQNLYIWNPIPWCASTIDRSVLVQLYIG